MHRDLYEAINVSHLTFKHHITRYAVISGYPYFKSASNKYMLNYIKNNIYTQEIATINLEYLDRKTIEEEYNDYCDFSDVLWYQLQYYNKIITNALNHFCIKIIRTPPLTYTPHICKQASLHRYMINIQTTTNQKYHKLTKSNTKKIYKLLSLMLTDDIANIIIHYYKFY